MATLFEATDVLWHLRQETPDDRPVLVAVDLDDTLVYASLRRTTDAWFSHELSKPRADPGECVLERWVETHVGVGRAYLTPGAREFFADGVARMRDVLVIAITARPAFAAERTLHDIADCFSGRPWPFYVPPGGLDPGPEGHYERGIVFTHDKAAVLNRLAHEVAPRLWGAVCPVLFLDDRSSAIARARAVPDVVALHIAIPFPRVGGAIAHHLASTASPTAWEDRMREVLGFIPDACGDATGTSLPSPQRLLVACPVPPRVRGVALSGRMGSGKSTVAERLVRDHGHVALSFAGPLKDLVAWLFDLPRDRLEGATPESRAWRERPLEHLPVPGLTPRRLLQLIGTDVGRHLDERVWLRSLTLRARAEAQAGNGTIVISDARFPNEIQAARKLGLVTVRIMRPVAPTVAEAAAPPHDSEIAHEGETFCVTIANTGTLQDLLEAADYLACGGGSIQ